VPEEVEVEVKIIGKGVEVTVSSESSGRKSRGEQRL
jgi:hypothetical protein